MPALPAIEGIDIAPMADADNAAVCEVIAAAFSRYEPMAVAAGQSHGEFLALVGLLVAEPAFRDLTFCARRADSGDIVGVMLATDFTTSVLAAVLSASPSFAPIGGVIGRLEERYIEARAPAPGACLDLAMLAVERDHGGRGIAQHLVAACIANGAAAGYRRAITMATNRTSRRVFEKLGFSELFSVAYKDYTFDGVRVFASIEADDRTALMEREL